MDLDGFKAVNDTFGHVAGDEILCRVAERLARAVREGDVVGRQHGDEFAVLLVNVVADEEASSGRGADPAGAPAGRSSSAARRSSSTDRSASRSLTATPIRLGATVAAQDVLVAARCREMYAAKALGKGTFAVFDPRMPVRTWTELEAAG